VYDNRQQASDAIRSVADRLSDMQRGEARQRIKAKEESQEKYRLARSSLQHRYRTDQAALLAERTWTCAYCKGVLAPTVYDDPINEGHVYVIQRDHCGCSGETDALRREREQAKKGLRDFSSAEWVIGLSRTGLTDWLTGATFDTFDAQDTTQAEPLRVSRSYCADLLKGELGSHPWLVLWGQYGTGKTHLSAAILHEALANGKTCRFRVWPQWLEQLQATFDGVGNSSQVVEDLKSGQVVVIDDIDKQHPTKSGWAEEKLYTALNHRYNTGKPTILTFNRPPVEMTPWLGPAVVDRIIERSYACVEFTGASHRSGRQW